MTHYVVETWVQDDVAHRGLKRAHSSSGVATEQPKRRSMEQQQPDTAPHQQQGQQQWRQPSQHTQHGSGRGVRRTTDPGSHARRPTQPIAIKGAGARPPTPAPTHARRQHHADGRVQWHSSTASQQQAAEPDPVVLSQLLDDTVQLLGHTSLIARQVCRLPQLTDCGPAPAKTLDVLHLRPSVVLLEWSAD